MEYRNIVDPEGEVFSRVIKPSGIHLLPRPVVRKQLLKQKLHKFLFAISIATVIALATQATAKAFIS